MINVEMNEQDFLNTIRIADIKLRNLFISKEISETEFKQRLRTVSLSKVYYKLNLVNFKK